MKSRPIFKRFYLINTNADEYYTLFITCVYTKILKFANKHRTLTNQIAISNVLTTILPSYKVYTQYLYDNSDTTLIK